GPPLHAFDYIAVAEEVERRGLPDLDEAPCRRAVDQCDPLGRLRGLPALDRVQRQVARGSDDPGRVALEQRPQLRIIPDRPGGGLRESAQRMRDHEYLVLRIEVDGLAGQHAAARIPHQYGRVAPRLRGP